MENIGIYDKVRTVPQNAQKKITGGRLSGMTDINPMWRISILTELFGPCGIGWKYVIREKRLEPGANGEIAAFVDIDLFYKYNGEWSDAVQGTGGAAFVAKERSGLYVSDECFKMALTDALSVACKALGVGADVYWEAGRSKYTQDSRMDTGKEQYTCAKCNAQIAQITKKDGTVWSAENIAAYSTKRFGQCLCPDCQKKAYKAEKEGTA